MHSTGWRGTTLGDGEFLIESGQNLADSGPRSNMSGFVTCFRIEICEILVHGIRSAYGWFGFVSGRRAPELTKEPSQG
jgi:hypothetical protein